MMETRGVLCLVQIMKIKLKFNWNATFPKSGEMGKRTFPTFEKYEDEH